MKKFPFAFTAAFAATALTFGLAGHPATALAEGAADLNLALPKEPPPEAGTARRRPPLNKALADPVPMLFEPNADDLIEVQPGTLPRKAVKPTTRAADLALAKQGRGGNGGLLKAYQKAYDFEPTFQTAKAEFDAFKVSASTARSALLPEIRYTKQRSELESSDRTTLSVGIPLLAVDRITSFWEGSHRDRLGALTYFQREQELAQRVFKTVSEIIKNQEALQANRAKLLAFKQQYDSAKKMYALGEGTVTDMSDTQVRLGQAKAENVVIQGRLTAALKQFEMTTGSPLASRDFQIRKEEKKFPVIPEAIELPYDPEGQLSNTQVGIARENHELAKLGTIKSTSAVLPNVTGSYVSTEINGKNTNYFGMAFTMPIQATGAWGIYGARANENRARESVREAENKALLEIEKLKSMLDSGIVEVKYRKENIDASGLNVVANQKSFRGGVKSKTDLLNAIQTQYQAHEEYVTSVLALAENYLGYLLALNVPPDAAVNLVNTLLF